MTGRVGEHMLIDLLTSGQRPCAQVEHSPGRVLKVVHHHVEMHLLGLLWIGPVRRLVVGRELERDTRGVIIVGYDDPLR